VHDVSFHAHPEWFGWKEGLRLRHLSRLSAGRAACIVACSAFTKAELVRHVPLAAGKVEVVYLGITQPRPGDRVTAGPHDPNAPPLVLYVGSMFARRHIPELVAGFSLLAGRHPRVRLHLVGENRATPPFDLDAVIGTSPAAARIRAVAYVGDAELTALYGGAAAFVFLSDYEGFGLTPLEALSAGVPIVVLDTPVAREVYGSAACFVAAPDPALVADALERVLFDAAERTRILAEAPPVLARYSWDTCAARTLELLAAAGR
jgi:glycosyltransferase involved in cell wall biosynthesis